MQPIIASACGLLFGFGLGVSGMTNPSKVLDFLDFAGGWDPTLMCVMGGAFLVTALGYALARRTGRPWFAASFSLPTRNDLDRDLVLGAALFGVGWGLVGLCPGPAIASVWRGSGEIFLFLGAMLGGVFFHRLRTRSNERSRTPAPS